MIKAINISKSYGKLDVFKNISLEIEQGKIISLIGASGAGKSSLLQILGLLDKPNNGEIYYFNERVDNLNSKKLNIIRNQKIGFVFQFHHLFPEFSALENVCIPGWIYNKNKTEVEKYAKELLENLGLKNRIYHKPKELSGGEQQRVAVARAMINKPNIIFADEPTGNLDSHNATLLHKIFQDLNKSFNQTFLIVTHNEELSLLSHKIIKMKDGNIFND